VIVLPRQARDKHKQTLKTRGDFSQWLGEQNQPALMTVTDNCERQQFGKYKPGRARGRCNDDDLNEWAAEVRKRSFCFFGAVFFFGD
jgi:hypothetical protein